MRPTTTTPTAEQEFPYGWRFVKQGEELVQVPLTLEDCLHPQEEDFIVNNIQHHRDCGYLDTVFHSRPLSPPRTLITCDTLINWGIPGIRNHCPDIAVFVGLSHDPDIRTGTVNVKELGARCELIVEVVSPSTRDNDVVHKFDHYFRVGIPLYIILDQEGEDSPRTLHAYRRTPTKYEEIPHDPQGRIALPMLGLFLGLRDDFAVCFDLKTQEEIEDFTRLSQARTQEREQFHHFKEEAEQAFQEQDKVLKHALKEADRALKSADLERQKREDAEKQILELQDKLRRLQSGDSTSE